MDDPQIQPKSALQKLEERGIQMLWSLIERDASTPSFWIKATVGMFVVTAGPMVAIWLFFLGRDLGIFE